MASLLDLIDLLDMTERRYIFQAQSKKKPAIMCTTCNEIIVDTIDGDVRVISQTVIEHEGNTHGE